MTPRPDSLILFLIRDRTETPTYTLAFATGREKAKREVVKYGGLKGDPDRWIVEPLTAPGAQVVTPKPIVPSDPQWEEAITDTVWDAIPARTNATEDDAAIVARAVVDLLTGKDDTDS